MFKKKVFEYNGHQIRKGAGLSGADLSGLVGRDVLTVLGSMEDLNFANANLTGANFDGLELPKVNFAGANLTGASFKKCWLPDRRAYGFSGANLSNATITTAYDSSSKSPEWWGTYGQQTIFTGANLAGATLGGVFSGFVFTDASLRGARISSGTTFHLCEFVGTDFSGSHFEGDQTFPPITVQNYPCVVNWSNLAGAKFVDVTGCGYFPQPFETPPPTFKVTDGIFYLCTSVVGNSFNDYKIFKWGPNPSDPNSRPHWFVALTPQGFMRSADDSTSASSGVETELAEVTELLSKGLIDQAEHDALRRNILGI